MRSECDVSVSKLLGFETFLFFWWFRIRYRKILVSKKVSDSVSKNSGIEKSIGIGIGKNLVSKKVSDSVSKKIGTGKSCEFGIRFRSDFGFGHTLAHNSNTFAKFALFLKNHQKSVKHIAKEDRKNAESGVGVLVTNHGN